MCLNEFIFSATAYIPAGYNCYVQSIPVKVKWTAKGKLDTRDSSKVDSFVT